MMYVYLGALLCPPACRARVVQVNMGNQDMLDVVRCETMAGQLFEEIL